jgi:hypothetical protein
MRDSSTWPDQRLYRLIFEHSSDPTVVVDDDGRVLLMNRAARELPGLDVERLFVWTPQRDAELTSFRAQLRVGGRASGEIGAPCKAGGIRRLSLEGKAHGAQYVVVMRDVTEQRRVEDELRHLRRLESIGLLTASVVHDFNNVLTAIVCSSALLAHQVADQEKPAELARDIQQAAERAAGMTRRTLSILRHEPAMPQRVSLSSAVSELRSLVQLVVGDGVELITDLDAELADATVEREQLDQVILNLAANARDAMPRGGKLVISTASVTLGADEADAAQCPSVGSYVALSMTDTGDGMPAEVRERIFERFFTTKEAGQGTGLGLATAHGFVKRSGGCISVRSAPGQGTTVLIYLPQAAPLARVIPLSRPEQEGPRGSETIVVVEPDDQVRGAVRAVLNERGYRVIDAPSGELALRQAQYSPAPIRLVLADASVRGTGGKEVAERLRRSGHPARVLLVSGHTDRSIGDLCLQGAPILRKVFSPVDLARRVRELLDATSAEDTGS